MSIPCEVRWDCSAESRTKPNSGDAASKISGVGRTRSGIGQHTTQNDHQMRKVATSERIANCIRDASTRARSLKRRGREREGLTQNISQKGIARVPLRLWSWILSSFSHRILPGGSCRFQSRRSAHVTPVQPVAVCCNPKLTADLCHNNLTISTQTCTLQHSNSSIYQWDAAWWRAVQLLVL